MSRNQKQHCPSCGAEMVPGQFEVGSTGKRFLVIGFSWDSLWFHADDPSAAVTDPGLVMDSGDERRGWVCRECYASVIEGPPDVARP